jgi:ATP-dependent DNA ligase
MIKTLYHKDSLGKIRVWTITLVDNGDSTDTIIETGLLNGAKIKNVTTVGEGKNFGKINETNHETQSLAEAESKIASKIKEGYVEKIEDVRESSILGSGIPAPMLANKHHPSGEQKGSKTLSEMKILDRVIIVQPKLDGNRCLIKVKDGVAIMYTRSGDIMPVQLAHILADVLKTYVKRQDFILDGELYSDKFSFNKLNGLIKRVTVSKEDIEERKNIKYHLYDVMSDEGYESRNAFLQRFASKNIIVVPSHMIVATDVNIKKYLEEFLSQGHEGLMIRQLGTGYENKRTWQLCKVKVFEDEEFKLVGFEEDKRGGFVGAFTMQIGDSTFNAGASGQSEEERAYIWTHQNEYIGKKATVCFFGRSEYGVPRFPKFKGMR